MSPYSKRDHVFWNWYIEKELLDAWMKKIPYNYSIIIYIRMSRTMLLNLPQHINQTRRDCHRYILKLWIRQLDLPLATPSNMCFRSSFSLGSNVLKICPEQSDFFLRPTSGIFATENRVETQNGERREKGVDGIGEKLFCDWKMLLTKALSFGSPKPRFS